MLSVEYWVLRAEEYGGIRGLTPILLNTQLVGITTITMENLSNWAGNLTYNAARIHRPKSLVELQELVVTSPLLKALGTRHSFNTIADTTGDLISQECLNQVVHLDKERSTVTVEAGIRYGELCRYLHSEGYALPNLASLPHISVVGACATATHGSGVGNGCLTTAVVALEMVTANGEVVTLSRDANPDLFPGVVVGLGGLGVVTKLTLRIEPPYAVRQVAYDNLPHAEVEAHFEEIAASAYSVSLFCEWFSDNPVWQVWQKQRVADTAPLDMALEWFGGTLATDHRHPIPSISAENCTPQLGIPGPWHERLPHFRLEFTPSAGEELQSEYLLPRIHAVDAFRAIAQIQPSLAPLLQVSEVRTVAADDFWMSPFYQQDSVAIHFTWIKDWEGVQQLLPLLEEQLAPFQARPHWGKLSTLPPERLRTLYPKYADYQNLLRHYDPQQKFRNEFLQAAFG